jgi:hypothetical protein
MRSGSGLLQQLMNERLVGFALLRSHLPQLGQQTRGRDGWRSVVWPFRWMACRPGGYVATVPQWLAGYRKSICESGICLALPPARLSRAADDPDCFLLMLRPPDRIHHKKNSPYHRLSDSLFLQRVLHISPIQAVGIAKNGRRFFKRNAVLFDVCDGFSLVPGEHMAGYTEIGDLSQPACNSPCPSQMAPLSALPAHCSPW